MSDYHLHLDSDTQRALFAEGAALDLLEEIEIRQTATEGDNS